MSNRWAIVITEHYGWNKDNPQVGVCPVESYPKAKKILDRYYSDYVEYYKARNTRRPMMPFDVKFEWKPEKFEYKMKLIMDVRDPQNKENLFLSYEICRTTGLRSLESNHRIYVHLPDLEPEIQ